VILKTGLLEESETPEDCAERELLEETGYHGKAIYTSWVKYNGNDLVPQWLMDVDPGFSNCNMRTVICQVDINDVRNQQPIPQREDGEVIEVFKVPLRNLSSELGSLEKEGYAITARLASFAMGIEIAKKYGIN
jgi:ADP-ribose pyrophosphatase